MKRIIDINTRFPILSIEDDYIINKMGDISLAFEVKLPEIFTLSESDYDNMHNIWTKAIGILPINTYIHKQDWYLESKYVPNYDAEYLLKAKIIAHENEKFFANRPYLNHRCYLIITKANTEVEKLLSTSSNLFRDSHIPKNQLNEKELKAFFDVVEQFTVLLKESGYYEISRMTGVQITTLYQEYLTLSNGDNSLKDIDFERFKVGEKHCQVFSVADLEEFPSVLQNQSKLDKYCTDKTFYSVSTGAHLGILLPINHIYNQVIAIIDHESLLKKLNKDIKRFTSLSAYSKENLINKEYKEAFVETAITDNEKAVVIHANVLIWDRDTQILDDNRSKTAAAITKMGFRPRQADFDGGILYWNSIPGNASDIGKDNFSVVFRGQAVCLLCLEANYQNTLLNEFQGTPAGMVVVDRLQGIPIVADFFKEPMEKGLVTNRNAMIVGPSGSGKSFLTNNLMYYLHEWGSHVIIVDTGNSYKRLCELVGGRYITYDEQKPIAFNPFYIPTPMPDLETKENLVTILEAIWKGSGGSTNTSENATLDDMVVRFYETLIEMRGKGKNIFPDFNLFFDFCETLYPKIFAQNKGREKEFDLDNFLYIMRRYYKDGQYGYLLNSRENLDISKQPFVVFELDNIKDHPVLFPVTSIIIMNAYVQKLINQKGFFKFLVIEEAWKAIANPSFAEFLKWTSKTARKHGGGLITVTQEFQDLMHPLVRDAIINNSPTKILLDFARYKNNFDIVAEVLGLTDFQRNVLLSVNQANDSNRKYKEFYAGFGDYAKVFGLEVSRTAYATFTTERRESDTIYALSNELGDIEKGVKAFANGQIPRNNN